MEEASSCCVDRTHPTRLLYLVEKGRVGLCRIRDTRRVDLEMGLPILLGPRLTEPRIGPRLTRGLGPLTFGRAEVNRTRGGLA